MSKIAVIETGGKQYVVSNDDVISVETRSDVDAPGANVTFDTVLLTDDGKTTTVGTPTVKDAHVTGEVLDIEKGPKVRILRYRSKSRHSIRKGHRQRKMKVKITNV